MREQEKISGRQALFLITTTLTITSVLVGPRALAATAGQDAWLAVLIATSISLITALTVVYLGLRFPDKTPVQYASDILGKWLAIPLGLSYVWFFLWLAGKVSHEFGEVFVVALLPDTPMEVFSGLLVVLAAITVYQGLEVLARVSELVLPLIVVPAPIIISLLAKDMRFEQLLPVLSQGWKPVIKAALPIAAIFGECLAIGFLIPRLNQPEEAKWVNPGSVLLAGAMVLITVVTQLAFFGPVEVGRLSFPTLDFSKAVHVAGFLTGLEPVIVAVWIAGMFVKVSVFYYIAVTSMAQLFDQSDYRPLVWPVGAILISLATLIFDGLMHFYEFLARFWPAYGLSMQLFVPAILLLVSLIRHKNVSPR